MLRLCYVNAPWAYFTDRARERWDGDGWHKRPYEHNAGEPYRYHAGRDSESPWQVVCVAFDGQLEEARGCQLNSPYSVNDINAGAVAWLRTSPYCCHDVPVVVIPAGTPFPEFCELVRRVGGHVYAETKE